ncbi:bifunctional phosphopantothenoylcysteine decarboxylase/phosphopantothenate--cysteine ligase CoaBC [Acidaminobacter sp.]|uniref:bifunctional phosphopantothenoylcysteine decarboxylase/phosphopantothenate--cysteine ligase CoaBC n=1 Tax=Acidaminobacter sp. TaxID=1872102 RepID=UPI0013848EB4|nr:bifunctional phosphopantothenoylcysteine decarboxylase/phosphopantothenate--cysteine ligase CoaBC [Acidaminobacter sp.]MDK9709631.1 bifunctional phosphopantothenoylcysteine decarboxylase/phosphopantothenate--cysteine ligase CoaBC [Acidaminobacter sp.]MZQ97848.1 bifunctional phosphopantothenoylcysteine decarboxylase/phosphopantothenate--cysteine ligase CoaBC [Acidaminobacter sp.]
MLTGKNIVLGVTGGIAAYKSADLVSRLKKLDANVYVVMTAHAKAFVSPLTFQSLSQNYVVEDMFEAPRTWDVEHIALAKLADLYVIAPASANVLAKMAAGIADDFLTTTILATQAPILVAPAMNTQMYLSPLTQRNMKTLQDLGVGFVAPGSGRLACGDEGIGKMAEPQQIVDEIVKLLAIESESDLPRLLEGKRVLITAGPTREALDPVRYLTNHSTGKMGYAIAEAAAAMGAETKLVSGPVELSAPEGVQRVKVESARDMFEAVMCDLNYDIIIMTAAVADYRPKTTQTQKIKKVEGDLTLELTRNPDILFEVGKVKTHQVLIGFAAETEHVIEHAAAKLRKKNLDMIVANDVTVAGAGFGSDTNVVTFITSDGVQTAFDQMEKSEVAKAILKKAADLLSEADPVGTS